MSFSIRPLLPISASARHKPCHFASPLLPPPGSTIFPLSVSTRGSSAVPPNREMVDSTICDDKERGRRSAKRERYFADEYLTIVSCANKVSARLPQMIGNTVHKPCRTSFPSVYRFPPQVHHEGQIPLLPLRFPFPATLERSPKTAVHLHCRWL